MPKFVNSKLEMSEHEIPHVNYRASSHLCQCSKFEGLAKVNSKGSLGCVMYYCIEYCYFVSCIFCITRLQRLKELYFVIVYALIMITRRRSTYQLRNYRSLRTQGLVLHRHITIESAYNKTPLIQSLRMI